MLILNQSRSNPKANLEPIRTQSFGASGANRVSICARVNFSSQCCQLSNRCQCMPIQSNPVPIQAQFLSHFKFDNQRQFLPVTVNSPIWHHFATLANHYFVNYPICANPSKSNANPDQFSANPMPLLRTIPALNLGTSVLYGMVPCLLGGWI